MNKKYSILFLMVVVFFSSCRVFNSSIMFKTPKDYKYATAPSDTLSNLYRISPNAKMEFKIFTNNGFKLVDLTSVNEFAGNGGNAANAVTSTIYTVEGDGTVKLPMLGYVYVNGLSVKECENILQEKYSKFYKDPFVMIRITNKRVMVFPGAAGTGIVVQLQNDNTTLIEALASAGGIALRGKAQKIKLIRGDLKNPQVFLIDLSTIEGIRQADLVIQNNDIIYVEPRNEVLKGILSEISPIISIVGLLVSVTIVSFQIRSLR